MIRDKYQVPHSVILRATIPDERAYNYVSDCFCLYEIFLEYGLCFPLPYTIKSALYKFRITLVWIMSNGRCTLIGLNIMSRMSGHTLSWDGLELLVQIKATHESERYYLTTIPSSMVIKDLDNENMNRKTKYFFIRGVLESLVEVTHNDPRAPTI